MSIVSEANPYPGINPHLNSALQQPGGAWRSFHTYFLTYTSQLLNRILPAGYYAQPEQSLQISVYDSDIDPLPIRRLKPVADVLIERVGTPATDVATLETSIPTLVLPIQRLIDDKDTPVAVLIYAGRKPVTRIEILSPPNKPGGSHFRDYATARDRALDTGLCLVEIDFLHERSPITNAIPSYPRRQPDAFPYSVLVSDPRPTRDEGVTQYYGFRVSDALPVISVPLEGKTHVPLSLGAVYATTFAERPFYSTVDYAQLPVRFETYDERDQAFILDQMRHISEAAS
jgi:hypothetical protein